MLQAHSVAQVRTAEAARMADPQLPAGALMRQAAAGLASVIAGVLPTVYGAHVGILVGAGNNGGDALYAGAWLARRGAVVSAILVADTCHRDGLAALRRCGGRVVEQLPTQVELIIDGITGIGGRPGLSAQAATVVDQLPDAFMVAVDVPSGVNVDTGEVTGSHIRADLTVTFGTHKVAHLVDPAAAACGAIELIDLGLELPPPVAIELQPDDVRGLLPTPAPADHKYRRGVVGVRAGSTTYPGAAVLTVAGASCGLAGMVRYRGSAETEVIAAHPHTVTASGRVQSWVVGSGGGVEAAEQLSEAAADAVPLVVDADALNFLPAQLPAGSILTPHAGELAQLLSVERAAVEAEQLAYARQAAQQFGAVVVLKGRHTICASPNGDTFVNTTGVPWLAQAGTGDVLAGLIGALVAGGCAGVEAAAVGAWLHGAAATAVSNGGPLQPLALAEAIPAVIADLLVAG